MSRRALIASAWTLVILVLCWLPRHRMPVHEEGALLMFIPNLDKVVHFGMFAAFAALWVWASPGGKRAGWVIFAGLVLAIVTELGQNSPYVNRDANVFDGLADFLGTLAGAFAALRWAQRPRAVAIAIPPE